MAVLMADLLIGNIADIISEQIKSTAGIVLFITFSAASILGQIYLLRKIKKELREESLGQSSLMKVVMTIQFVLIAIIISVVLQIILSSVYLTNLLAVSTAISYGLTVILMGILAWRFLIWFKRSKNLALLLYGFAAAVISFNSIVTIILFDVILLEKPQTVTPESEVIFNLGFEPGTPMSVIITIQAYSFSAYTILAWAGTVVILYHNVQRIGRIKFWALVLLPLVYFLSYTITIYQELYPDSTVTQAISVNFAIPILIGTLASTTCGILFGLGFLVIAWSISANLHVREYLMMAGFGFMLFINAASATVLQAAYPPFGLANVSFVSLSAFLIFIGLYRSALVISRDIKLRQLIGKSLLKDSGFLSSIGNAQMMYELENKVLDIVKKNSEHLEEESGVRESSMTDLEIRKYVNYVVTEVRKGKRLSI